MWNDGLATVRDLVYSEGSRAGVAVSSSLSETRCWAIWQRREGFKRFLLPRTCAIKLELDLKPVELQDPCLHVSNWFVTSPRRICSPLVS